MSGGATDDMGAGGAGGGGGGGTGGSGGGGSNSGGGCSAHRLVEHSGLGSSADGPRARRLRLPPSYAPLVILLESSDNRTQPRRYQRRRGCLFTE